MSTAQAPSSPPLQTPSSVAITPTPATSSPPGGVWDRLTKWASENKALVYTIAGTAVVVTSAGVVYYLAGPSRVPSQPTEKRKSKKVRRQEKKKAEDEKKAEKAPAEDSGLKAKKAAEEAPAELPEVDEESVEKLDDEVGMITI